jgi:hypothetical protein
MSVVQEVLAKYRCVLLAVLKLGSATRLLDKQARLVG